MNDRFADKYPKMGTSHEEKKRGLLRVARSQEAYTLAREASQTVRTTSSPDAVNEDVTEWTQRLTLDRPDIGPRQSRSD